MAILTTLSLPTCEHWKPFHLTSIVSFNNFLVDKSSNFLLNLFHAIIKWNCFLSFIFGLFTASVDKHNWFFLYWFYVLNLCWTPKFTHALERLCVLGPRLSLWSFLSSPSSETIRLWSFWSAFSSWMIPCFFLSPDLCTHNSLKTE